MEQLKNIKAYKDFELAFDKELARQAESFVRVGYLLKVARDTNILAESGYGSVAEFAKERYGLSKDIVSRYIHINDRFSENGYSECLAEQYRGFGYSKLAIMLTLPDTVADALTPQMSKTQIAAVQKVVKEEQQIPPLQVIMEGQNKEQHELGTDLQRFLHQYGYECRKKVQALVNAAEGENFIEETLDIIAPSGVAMLSVRIPGRGRLMLSIKGKDEKLTLIDVRQNENSEWQWEELKNDIKTVYQEGTEEAWERIYGEPFKKEEEKQIEEPERTKSEQQSEEKAAVQEQHDSERKEIDAKNRDDKEGSVSGSDKQLGEQIKGMVQKEEGKQTVQDGGAVQDGGDRIVKLKQECATEEIKDELFGIWFDNVAEEKIKAACKIMSTMRFADLINSTPRKLFLLAQTSEITTEEVKQNGELLTKVEDSSQTALFTAQDFLKRFTKKFLDPYKEKIQQSVSEKQESVPESHKNVSEVQESVLKQSNIVSESTKVAPVQMQVDDYPELKPDDVIEVEHEKIQEENAFTTVAFRCLPNDVVHFLVLNKVEEAKVTEVRLGEDLIQMITVKATDPNALIVVEFNQKEDWGKKLFRTRAAAEQALKQ